MFSLLNKEFPTGKLRARMCKFLNSLPQFFRSLGLGFLETTYLVEDVNLTSINFAPVGHRIAFLICQPVQLEIRFRKD